ncbi:MAG: uroporphyrinogen decarboxylase family protein [Planctomycetota bacterium]
MSHAQPKDSDLRQDVLDAVARRVPHRIPYTYNAREETDRAFRDHLGLTDKQTIEEVYRCNRFTSPWSVIGGRWHVPGRGRGRSGDDEMVDLWGCRRVKTPYEGGYYYELAEPPLAGARTVADIEAYDWPDPSEIVWPELPENIDLEQARTDVVVNCMDFICPFGIPWAMRGMENLMTDVALNPAIVECMVEKVEQFTLAAMTEMFRRYPGVVDLVGCGDDYGTQISLFLSKDMIDRFFMPSLTRHYEVAARHGAAGYHHCCGAIVPIIPSFIEAGVKVLNPIQTSATGMDPAFLKKEFGQHLCFHGSIDIQQTLVTGTPAEVRDEVKDRIDTLGPEGFILAPSHVLQPDTPVENLQALYDAAVEFC